MSFSSLPIIDLKEEESIIIQSLFNACSTTGFFYVRNHDFLDAQQQMFELVKELFRLPLNVKEQYAIKEDNFGYVRRGKENLAGTASNIIDEKEAFNMKKSIQPNLLPSVFAKTDNYDVLTKFHRSCYDLAMKLLNYLARSLDIDPDYFTSRHKWEQESGDTLRFLHYPHVETYAENSIRAAAHSDYGSLTLLFQHEHKSGLEVLNRATNIWHPVEPFDDMIVVNFGDAFEYWSKGFIKSTVHRVTMPMIDPTRDNERFSIAYFCHPNDSTLLTPIPSKYIVDRIFEKDGHSKQALDHENEEKLTAGAHLAMRLGKTYTY